MGEKEKEKRQEPISLLKLVTLGVSSSVLVVGGLFLLFAAYEAEAWLFWTAEERLDPDTLFGVGRNAVTLAAALGVGVTLFFSYRKQQTAEGAQALAVQAQNMALESQRLATETLQLSLDKHELERVSELRNRYARSAEQLANEKHAIQLAGIHSLASLADDWISMGNEDDQQVCIALLASYISGGKYDSDNPDQTPENVAVEVMSSRLQRDLLHSHKSWSSKIIRLNGAPMMGWTDVTITGGKHTFMGCHWLSIAPRSFTLEGGKLRIYGNLSHRTYPASIMGRFTGGSAGLTVAANSPNVTRFFKSKFDGSAVTLRALSDSSVSVVFSECEFISGRVTISRPDKFMRITFNSCRFVSHEMLRFAGSFDPANIALEDCTFRDTAGERPYSTEEFIAHLSQIRTVSKRSKGQGVHEL